MYITSSVNKRSVSSHIINKTQQNKKKQNKTKKPTTTTTKKTHGFYIFSHTFDCCSYVLSDTDKDRQYFYDKINVIFNHFKSSSCQDDYHGLKR